MVRQYMYCMGIAVAYGFHSSGDIRRPKFLLLGQVCPSPAVDAVVWGTTQS